MKTDTHESGIPDEDFRFAKGELVAADALSLENLLDSLTGFSLPVGPGLRRHHLVAVQELWVDLPEGVASAPHPNILHQPGGQSE